MEDLEAKRLKDFALARKRTCPRCGEMFLTRKNKRIHRKLTNFKCSTEN